LYSVETPIDSMVETLGVAHCCWVRGWMCLAGYRSTVWYWAALPVVLLVVLLVDWYSVSVVWPVVVIPPEDDMLVAGTLADDMPAVGSTVGDSMPDGDGSMEDDTQHSYGTSQSCMRIHSSSHDMGCSAHESRR